MQYKSVQNYNKKLKTNFSGWKFRGSRQDNCQTYLDKLGPDVLELVFKLDGLGNGDAVFGDLGGQKWFLT